jgi:hypothetical protein
MTLPRFTVAMLGARMNYAVPRALHRSGQLNALLTDLYLPDGPARRVLRALSAVPGAQSGIRSMLGRYNAELDGARIVSRQASGLQNILRRRRADSGNEVDGRAVTKRAGARMLADMLADLSEPGDAVYAFQEAARAPFEAAKSLGMACVMEQSIAARPFSLQLLEAELDRWGSWFTEAGVPQSTPDKVDQLQAEWEAADKIVAASEFVRTSLLACGVPEDKIVVFPYGVTLSTQGARLPDYDGTRPLRVLFAGNARLRKGIHHLLQAAETLGPKAVDLRVVGEVGLKPEPLARFAAVADFRGRVPRSEMPDHFHWADVFILPTLIEGSATVVYEALSFGLPAVVTPNAGSVVEDGHDGQVIAASSPEAIVTALGLYLDDPQRLHAQAAAAREAGNKISYARYESDLQRFFRSFDVKAAAQ